jgi:hypothetical protein
MKVVCAKLATYSKIYNPPMIKIYLSDCCGDLAVDKNKTNPVLTFVRIGEP